MPYLSTLDGSSHVYSAIVARDLLTKQDSPYAAAYEFNTRLVPNWGTTVLMNVSVALAGTANAEKLAMSLAVLIGFFSLSYAIGGFAPSARWTPVANFLLQSWFLWIGFYSFYLGMVLSLLLAGYYVRVQGRLTPRRLLAISAALALLYLVHLIGALVAAGAVVVLAVWKYFAGSRAHFRDVLGLLAASAPLLILVYVFAGGGAVTFAPSMGKDFVNFPAHIFSTGDGLWGNQRILWPFILGCGVFACVAMKREERKLLKGGWVAMTALLFLAYFLLPDEGLGGSMVKIRFAWAVFLFLGVLAASVEAMLRFRMPIAIVTTILLGANLTSTAQSAQSASRAIEDYAPLAARIRPGATLIRLNYPMPSFAERYGRGQYGRYPLFHADAYFAALCGCLDLSDYEGLSRVFPITLRKPFDDVGLRDALWALERPTQETSAGLRLILDRLPVRVEYAIVIADEKTSVPGFDDVLSELDSKMRLVGRTEFTRLYERAAQ